MWDIQQVIELVFEQISPMELLFCGMIASVTLLGFLVGILEPHLPSSLTQFYRFGKHSLKENRCAIVNRLEISKSSFRHFYVFSIALCGITLFLIVRTYISGEAPPDSLIALLDFMCSKRRKVKGSPLATLLAATCIFLQCLRRFWETHFVQVFAQTSRINVAHYILGYVHYIGASLAILAHAPGFVEVSGVTVSGDQLSWRVVLSGFTFIFAWWQQWRANRTLANLRKDHVGNVVTEKHLLPTGGFFEVVSSPHMLFECLMYVSLVPILSGNTDWLLVTAWVVTNQAQVAHFTHIWYRENFPHYPKIRKALIPGIF